MAQQTEKERVRFVIDEEGNKTSVILSIELFESMLDTIEELEDHYFAHHPEERAEKEVDFTPFSDLEKLLGEEQ